jgi:hypothetical protein
MTSAVGPGGDIKLSDGFFGVRLAYLLGNANGIDSVSYYSAFSCVVPIPLAPARRSERTAKHPRGTLAMGRMEYG